MIIECCQRRESSVEEALIEMVSHLLAKRSRPMAIMPSLPDGKSCLNLAAARLRHIEGPQWPTRKYTNMTPLLAHQTQEAVVA